MVSESCEEKEEEGVVVVELHVWTWIGALWLGGVTLDVSGGEAVVVEDRSAT